MGLVAFITCKYALQRKYLDIPGRFILSRLVCLYFNVDNLCECDNFTTFTLPLVLYRTEVCCWQSWTMCNFGFRRFVWS
jgi:hypothetical protein